MVFKCDAGMTSLEVMQVTRQDRIEGKVLVQLYVRKAFDEQSAVLLSELGVTPKQVKRLVKDDRMIAISTNNTTRVFLTGIGMIVAMGECSIQLKRRKDRQ